MSLRVVTLSHNENKFPSEKGAILSLKFRPGRGCFLCHWLAKLTTLLTFITSLALKLARVLWAETAPLSFRIPCSIYYELRNSKLKMFILGVGRKRFFCMFFLATSVFKKTIFVNRKFFADLFISQIISR